MMKKTLLALLLGLFLCGCAVAQTAKVVRNDFAGATYTFSFGDPDISTRTCEGIPYDEVTLPASTPSTEIGLPNLPIVSKMIEIPLCEGVQVVLSDVETVALPSLKNLMMPVQPAPSKSDHNPRPFLISRDAYAADSLYSHPAAWVETLGVGRDRNLALLRLSPLSYNPVTGEMVLIKSLTVSLSYLQADRAATLSMRERYYSPDFTVGASLLSTLPSPKAVRNQPPLHYLIVAHSMFRGQLDSLVSWKKRQGFLVTTAYTDDPGVGTTSTAIANYIKGFYTNATEALPAPTYLLLVGDEDQIPAFDARCTSPAYDHVTDLYYVTWTPNDNIPDCYVGRFSARSAAELAPQIEKTIYYERYDFAGNADNYLQRGILIAGEDRGSSSDNAYTYADPAMDYLAKTYINAGNGYTDVRYYKNNTDFAPDGVTVTGCSQTSASASALRSLYNTGYGWINYSAHGYDNEWSTPEFTTTHVQSMTNNGKPSIMIGNCCLSGKFNTSAYDACLGEALLRKENNAGAVAYIGGTNSTYWPHDFCWSVGVRNNFSNTMNTSYDSQNLGLYDRLFHTHNEDYTLWHTTTGAMVTAGNTAVESYGSFALYYWEIYELFGDPSLMPWLSKPQTMDVDAPATLTLGTPSYTVQAVPHAYVALTTAEGHDLICAAYADAVTGEAELTLPDELEPGDYELAVWAQNYKPYFQEVSAIVLDGPFLKIDGFSLPGGVLRPGSINTVDIALSNIGTAASDAGSVTFTLSGGATLMSAPFALSPMAAGQTDTLVSACKFYLPLNHADGDIVTLNATISYGDRSNSRRRTFTIAAPRLEAGTIAVSPAIDTLAQSCLTCRVTNTGSDTTTDLTLTLAHRFGMVSVPAEGYHAGRIIPGESRTATFYFTMGAPLPDADIPFELRADDGENSQLLKAFTLRPGTGDIEDFETGNFTRHNWTQETNAWEIDNTVRHAGTFSARSTRNLSDRSESEMSLTWTSTQDDSIRFWYKVSSENNYDKFTFSIDYETQITASGEEDWTRFACPVAAGRHTFSFTYKKDYNRSSGSDCAWIDDLVFPSTAQVHTFLSDSVCQGAEYTFGGRTLPTDQIGTAVYTDTADTPAHLSLTVVGAPEVHISASSRIAVGRYLVLTASGADSYLWSTGDTTPDIVVLPEAGTRYTVTGYRAGCSGEASISVADGIGDNTVLSPIALYPNPADNQVTVRGEGLRSLTVTNALGQTVLSQRVSGGQALLSLRSLPKGIYFVRVETTDAVQVKKLIRR